MRCRPRMTWLVQCDRARRRSRLDREITMPARNESKTADCARFELMRFQELSGNDGWPSRAPACNGIYHQEDDELGRAEILGLPPGRKRLRGLWFLPPRRIVCR